VLLPKLGRELKEAGVKRLNISLDTLDADKYAYITRIGTLDSAMAGIEAAIDLGFDKIKLNAVLIGGFNDDEIRPLAELTKKYPLDMRFIEMMPMYDSGDFKEASFIPNQRVLEVLPELEKAEQDGSVANLYRLPGAQGNVGLLSPVSDHFCASCNRIRLTADGKLKPCLHSGDEFSIKGLNREEMLEQFRRAILSKPACHGELSHTSRSQAGRNMNQIGG
jgi:cyclic pyranopterin phosphate synthase